MSSKIESNLCIIGAGKIANEHLKVINDIKYFNIHGIYSRTRNKALKLSKIYNISKIYKNLDEILLDENIDAYLILVSASQTFKVLKKIIPNKKNFFVEKPAGQNFQESIDLVKLIRKNQNLNMVGFNRRFFSIFEKGLSIIKKNGNLLGVKIEGHERFWKIKKNIYKRNINNWAYVNSSHTIDLIRFFVGELKEIKSYNSKLIEKKNDQFVLAFKSLNNIIGTYTAHWYSPGGWSVTLFGDKVKVVFDPLESGYYIDKNFKKHNLKLSKFDILYKPGLYKQMLAFKKLLINKKNSWPSQAITESHKTMQIIYKMQI